jgi:hypothetical protein
MYTSKLNIYGNLLFVMFTYTRFSPVPLLLLMYCRGWSQYHRSSHHRPSGLPTFLLPRNLYFSRPLLSLLFLMSSTCALHCHFYVSAITTTLSNFVVQRPREVDIPWAKKFPAFYGTRRFTTVSTSTPHLSISPPPSRCGPTRAVASSCLLFLDHTQRHTTVVKTNLDWWAARRRNLYLTTHNKQSCSRRDSNP